MDPTAVNAGLRVLIAEDNPDGAATLAYILRQAGHAVRVVGDGGGAVSAALAEPPDVVLLDVGLPDLDGWEAAWRIRRGLGERPCLLVAITGYDQPADRERSLAAGIHKHFRKPVDLDELTGLLARYSPDGV